MKMEKHNFLPFAVQKSLLERQYKVYCLMHVIRICVIPNIRSEMDRMNAKRKVDDVIIS